MGGEEKRHQMMQNLFGDQSEEEEEEVDSEHESNPQPPQQYLSVRSLVELSILIFAEYIVIDVVAGEPRNLGSRCGGESCP